MELYWRVPWCVYFRNLVLGMSDFVLWYEKSVGVVRAAYFGVDVLNMLNNDFVLKDPGYQKPLNRAVEYLHHFIVLPSVCPLARTCYWSELEFWS